MEIPVPEALVEVPPGLTKLQLKTLDKYGVLPQTPGPKPQEPEVLTPEQKFKRKKKRRPLPENIPEGIGWPNNKIGRTRVRKFTEAPVCYYCDREHKKINRFTVDHVEPSSKGGKNGTNLVLSCKSCNQDKTDYTPEQYMELCVKRAKRVMYANHPSFWNKARTFCRFVWLWFKTKDGIR